ncbi:MAG: NADH-quinone oxidoreductase subunit J [Nitrospirae bacterium]|nr:NADH-quinone oxidoreductase subunit J [Nitrospirota bacterium]
MNAVVFYILGFAVLTATFMAVTRRETMHAVIYLVMSFFALSLIFYMMGAPLIAALEVIIYAGAIMVLFLFVVMMLDMGMPTRPEGPFMKTWLPAIVLAGVILVCSWTMFTGAPEAKAAYISPRTFGYALYTKYMLAVEIASLLLLFALVGALYLGRRE